MSDDSRNKPLSPRHGKPRVNIPGQDGLAKGDFEQRRVVKPSQPKTRMKPHIGKLLADSYTAISYEMQRLRERLEMGEQLTDNEARRLNQYVDSITKLAREEREQEAKNDPSQYTPEELVELLPKAAEALGLPLDKLLDTGSDED